MKPKASKNPESVVREIWLDDCHSILPQKVLQPAIRNHEVIYDKGNVETSLWEVFSFWAEISAKRA